MKVLGLPLRSLAKPALLFGGLLLAGLALRSLPLGTDPESWKNLLGSPGAASDLTFVTIAAVATAVGIPRQAAAFAGGWLFGPWLGFALAMAGQLLGAVLDFYWARWLARDWAQRRLPPRLQRVDQFLTRNAFTTTLTLRLLPVGNNTLLNLAAGLSGVNAAAFLAGSAVGYVPQTLIFALLGAGEHVGQGAEIWLSAGLFVASVLLGALFYYKSARTGPSRGG